jgi:outer membrane protein TolC
MIRRQGYRMGRLPAVLLLSALWGCADINDARQAKDPEKRRAGERTVSAEDAGLVPGSILTVDQAVSIALKYQPTIAFSRASVELSQATLEQVNAGFLPQISVSANYRWNRTGGAGALPPPGKPIANSGLTQTQGGNVLLNQLLFDWGKTSSLSDQAYTNFVAAQSDLASSENDAVFNARSAFFNVLKQEELVRVGEETVRQFEKRLEQVKGFVDAGTRQKYDLTKAQVDLGNAQLTLVKARTALTVARATLNTSLGLASEPQYTLDRKAPPGTWSMPFDDAVAAARAYHPALQSLILRENAARYAIEAAIADFYPAISLQGSFSWTGGLLPANYLAFLGPVLNWVVFSGWNKTGVLHGAVASLREAYANRAQEEQLLFLDLRQAYAALEDTRESMKIASLTVKSAEETLDLVTGRFQVGKASSVELTDAQVALANARAAEIQARYDFEISIAAIQRSIGGARKP